MSETVYRICLLLCQVLHRVPVGTNLGLLHLLLALVSGRFLPARGAVFAALTALGLPAAAVRRANAALAYGCFTTDCLLTDWQRAVFAEGRFRAHRYEGYRPVACDLTGFFRPQLRALTTRHYAAHAGKALPAVPVGMAVSVGSVGSRRLGLLRLLVQSRAGDTDTSLQRRLLQEASQTLSADEALVVDAGFPLADLLACQNVGFVVRVKKNATFRRKEVPVYRGKGRPPVYGERVRPLARRRAEKDIPATPPDATARWKDGRHSLRAHIWHHLVLPNSRPGAVGFRCVVIVDPRYKEPLVLVSNLPVSAYALWRLYRDRWAVEQLPLAAKQMLGTERAFVFSQASRTRLPQMALLAGNVLSYVAATSQPVATGFWDRACRPSCGRLRRALSQVHFAELPLPEGQLRKKRSPTGHLPKGVAAHRRTKEASRPAIWAQVASFTGN